MAEQASGGHTPRRPAARLLRWWERRSLAFRLFLLATCWSLLALLVAGFVLLTSYRATTEDAFERRLELHLLNLVASIDQSQDGLVGSPNLGEPRFGAFHSGWYWQVTVESDPLAALLSPSLAGERLAMPSTDELPFDPEYRRAATLEGPDGARIRAIEQVVLFDRAGEQLRFVVTGALADVEAEIAAFRGRLSVVFAVLGAGLVSIAVAQVMVGLRPLYRLRGSLAAIREGRAAQLSGNYPVELMPLVREMNGLLASNAKIVERARTHVGNLAHGLKTPLSVLFNEARASGGALAEKVIEQATVMRHQLDLYLERAQMAGRSQVLGAVCEIRPAVEALRRAMARIYEERALRIASDVPAGLRFRGERQDLEEMIGNLVDNACKWANGTVSIVARAEGETVIVDIDDDGPGLPAERRADALTRGTRIDTSRPGSGLGLSIVAELAELYEGRLELAEAPAGGLRARLVLPRA